MDHRYQDRVSLEMARRIASGLADHPEWIEHARMNLRRWSELNADAPGLLRCYDEWRQILERPIADVRAVLLAENDEGQRLRQSSPFAGVLSPREVWAIKEHMRNDTAAA